MPIYAAIRETLSSPNPQTPEDIRRLIVGNDA
jgi:hypothetical protein